MVEKWLPVVGYEGFYEVSSLGRVRSVDRVTKKKCKTYSVKGKLLKQTLDSHYPRYQVSLCKAGEEHLSRVHVLVAEAFLGPRPENLVVCHGARGSLCNEITNLYYGTHKDNAKDKLRDNTDSRGHKHHNVKLTEDDVRNIRLNKESLTAEEWAKRLGVSRRTVSAAKTGQTWAWLICEVT
jgi:DNA-binding transcriptional regulator YiaG